MIIYLYKLDSPPFNKQYITLLINFYKYFIIIKLLISYFVIAHNDQPVVNAEGADGAETPDKYDCLI